MQTLLTILSELDVFRDRPLVLVDVGASGDPPPIWKQVAPQACYIGFDPDLRALKEDNSFGFQRFILVNQAIADRDTDSVQFFLTASPYCSSLLPPDPEACHHYIFADLFEVVGNANVSATTLERVLADVNLRGIDWIKFDTQGKDVDLFLSITSTIRDRILAVDVEPGMMPFYRGENTFCDAHHVLIKAGFWLSHLDMQCFPRMEQSTKQFLTQKQQVAIADLYQLNGNPTAAEARYLRTLESMQSIDADRRDYVCLWAFAMLDNSLGFALDVALHVAQKLEAETLGNTLVNMTSEAIQAAITAPSLSAIARLKSKIRGWLRRL